MQESGRDDKITLKNADMERVRLPLLCRPTEVLRMVLLLLFLWKKEFVVRPHDVESCMVYVIR